MGSGNILLLSIWETEKKRWERNEVHRENQREEGPFTSDINVRLKIWCSWIIFIITLTTRLSFVKWLRLFNMDDKHLLLLALYSSDSWQSIFAKYVTIWAVCLICMLPCPLCLHLALVATICNTEAWKLTSWQMTLHLLNHYFPIDRVMLLICVSTLRLPKNTLWDGQFESKRRTQWGLPLVWPYLDDNVELLGDEMCCTG